MAESVIVVALLTDGTSPRSARCCDPSELFISAKEDGRFEETENRTVCTTRLRVRSP